MKVLTIGHSYNVALNRSIVREIARDEKFEITVGAPQFFHGTLRPVINEKEPADSPLRVVALPSYFTFKMHIFCYGFFQLRKLLRSEKFDLVHVWEEPYVAAGFEIALACRLEGVPFFFRTAQSLNKKYPFPFSWMEKRVLAWKAGWIAGGNLVFKNMVERGLPENEGRVITLAVDTQLFKPATLEKKKMIREQVGLSGPVVGMLGRLSEEKGCDLVMEAFDKIGGEHPWSLFFLGSGVYKKKIEDWAEKRGWKDRVKVQLVLHDEVPAYLPVFDLMIAPSQTRPNWKEQFGRMLIEAFAAGVPVIASDSGEIPSVVDKYGVILPESDVDAWAREIEKLLADEPRRIQMAENGIERAEYYSTQRIANQFKEFYRDVLASL